MPSPTTSRPVVAAALDAARRLEGVGIAEEVEAAGLRGRGGAGFPTGVKWKTVAASVGSGPPPIVVVNGAEGEPGSFKDRMLLRRNPYRVLEGALIAAIAVHARHVVVALKRSFQTNDGASRTRSPKQPTPDGWAMSTCASRSGRASTCSARRPHCSR